jgi:hypothetical protein
VSQQRPWPKSPLVWISWRNTGHFTTAGEVHKQPGANFKP